MAKSRKKFKKDWFLWVALFLLIVYLGQAVYSEFVAKRALEKELLEAQQETELILEDIAKLELDLEASFNERQVEKEARRTLNLKREGEEVFVVVGIDDISKPENFEEIFNEPFEGNNGVWLNIKKWYRYFLGD